MRAHIRFALVLTCAPLVACGGAGGGGGAGGPVPLVATGLFVPASAPESWSGLDVRGMVVRDQDGDGVLDLVAAHIGAPGLVSARGLGDGHFEAPVGLGTYPGAGGLVLSDLDGDGQPEALVLDWTDLVVLVGDGNADGTFDAPIGYSTGVASESFAVGDVNGDLDPDVISGSPSGIPLWLGNMGTTFKPGTAVAAGDEYFVALADVNEDGDLDVLSRSNAAALRCRLGNGDGTFGAPTDAPVPDTAIQGPMELGDVNGDGHLDVVACRSLADTVGVSLGDGKGGFTAAPDVALGQTIQFAYLCKLVHLNGDAHLDLLVSRENAGEVHVFHGVGDGTFTPRQVLTVSPQPRALLVADLNGDGANDLLVGCIPNGGTLYAFLGTKQ